MVNVPIAALASLNKMRKARTLNGVANAILDSDPELNAIVISLGEKHGVGRAEFLAPRGRTKVAAARHELCYRALTETSHSAVMIAKALARGHTAVLYGAAMHAKRNNLAVPRMAENMSADRQLARLKSKGESIHGEA